MKKIIVAVMIFLPVMLTGCPLKSNIEPTPSSLKEDKDNGQSEKKKSDVITTGFLEKISDVIMKSVLEKENIRVDEATKPRLESLLDNSYLTPTFKEIMNRPSSESLSEEEKKKLITTGFLNDDLLEDMMIIMSILPSHYSSTQKIAKNRLIKKNFWEEFILLDKKNEKDVKHPFLRSSYCKRFEIWEDPSKSDEEVEAELFKLRNGEGVYFHIDDFKDKGGIEGAKKKFEEGKQYFYNAFSAGRSENEIVKKTIEEVKDTEALYKNIKENIYPKYVALVETPYKKFTEGIDLNSVPTSLFQQFISDVYIRLNKILFDNFDLVQSLAISNLDQTFKKANDKLKIIDDIEKNINDILEKPEPEKSYLLEAFLIEFASVKLDNSVYSSVSFETLTREKCLHSGLLEALVKKCPSDVVNVYDWVNKIIYNFPTYHALSEAAKKTDANDLVDKLKKANSTKSYFEPKPQNDLQKPGSYWNNKDEIPRDVINRVLNII